MKKIYALLLAAAMSVPTLMAAPVRHMSELKTNLAQEAAMPHNTLQPSSVVGLQPMSNAFMLLSDYTERPWSLVSLSFYAARPGYWCSCVSMVPDPEVENGVKMSGFFGFTEESGQPMYVKGTINIDEKTLTIPYGQQIGTTKVHDNTGKEYEVKVYFAQARPVMNDGQISGLTPSMTGSLVLQLQGYQDEAGNPQFAFDFPCGDPSEDISATNEYFGAFLRYMDDSDFAFIDAYAYAQMPEANGTLEFNQYVQDEEGMYGDETKAVKMYIQTAQMQTQSGQKVFQAGPFMDGGDGALVNFYASNRGWYEAIEQLTYYDGRKYYLSTYYRNDDVIENEVYGNFDNDNAPTEFLFDLGDEADACWTSAAGHGVISQNNPIYAFPPCTTATIKLGNIVLPGGSGIENIENVANNNGKVTYYNLQGMPVAQPQAGQIVIRRQGTEATKVLVK